MAQTGVNGGLSKLTDIWSKQQVIISFDSVPLTPYGMHACCGCKQICICQDSLAHTYVNAWQTTRQIGFWSHGSKGSNGSLLQ